MKHLLIVLIVLVGCNTTDEPSYSDITGKWTFEIDSNAKGYFIINKADNTYRVQSGEITIYGKVYVIGKITQIDYLYVGRLNTILLETLDNYDQANYASILLQKVDINGDYSLMISNRSTYSIYQKGDGTNSPIQVIR